MSGDPIAALELELLAAGRRRVDVAAAELDAGAGASTGALGLVLVTDPIARPGRRWNVGGIVAIAASVIVVLGVGAAILLAGQSAPRPVAASASVTGRLVDGARLAVLARPQTAADRDPATLRQIARLEASALSFKADLAGMRLAAVTPWGARVVLVPFSVSGSRQLLVFVGGAVWGGGSLSQVDERGIQAVIPAGRAGRTHVAEVVPDGVARVSLAPPGGPAVGSAVAANVAALTVAAPQSRVLAGTTTLTWYGPTGRVIRRVHPSAPVVATATMTARPLTSAAVRRLLRSMMPVLNRRAHRRRPAARRGPAPPADARRCRGRPVGRAVGDDLRRR